MGTGICGEVQCENMDSSRNRVWCNSLKLLLWWNDLQVPSHSRQFNLISGKLDLKGRSFDLVTGAELKE